MNVEDFITHIDHDEDLPYLKTKLFDVNMRLYATSAPYKALVQNACNYVAFLCKTEMQGYKRPHGMSGANAAVPWNIIAYLKNRSTSQEECVVMINPRVKFYSEEKVQAESNCGSIRLEKPIMVERSKGIVLEWHNMDGDYQKGSFSRGSGALTIQHEVDHNNGILITDREVK